jgi:hypothetical protein
VPQVLSPRLARASVLWAVLAAVGAAFFVSSLLLVVLFMAARFLGAPTEWIGGVATVAATATALSVAYTVGGRDAVLVYAGILILDRLLGLLGLMRFCLAIVSDSSVCSPFAYILGLWPEAVGVVLAYQLVRWMRAMDGDRNPLLEAAGALALTQRVVASFLGAFLLPATQFEAGLGVLASAVAAGVACGLVLVRRVPESHQWRSLGLIALVVLGVWLLVSLPSFVGQVGIGGTIAIAGLNLIGFASPLVETGVAALVLYMAAARKVTATQRERPQGT